MTRSATRGITRWQRRPRPGRARRGAWYHRPWATLIGMIETDSFFSFTHFENPQGDKERTHEFHTRELARQLIFNELDGPREATPAGTRSKRKASASGLQVLSTVWNAPEHIHSSQHLCHSGMRELCHATHLKPAGGNCKASRKV